jgi:hypothetical protein
VVASISLAFLQAEFSKGREQPQQALRADVADMVVLQKMLYGQEGATRRSPFMFSGRSKCSENLSRKG